MRLRALTRGPPGGCVRRTRARRHRRQVSGCGALRAGQGVARGSPQLFPPGARASRAHTLPARARARSYAQGARLCSLCVHAGEDESGKRGLAWRAAGEPRGVGDWMASAGTFQPSGLSDTLPWVPFRNGSRTWAQMGSQQPSLGFLQRHLALRGCGLWACCEGARSRAHYGVSHRPMRAGLGGPFLESHLSAFMAATCPETCP